MISGNSFTIVWHKTIQTAPAEESCIKSFDKTLPKCPANKVFVCYDVPQSSRRSVAGGVSKLWLSYPEMIDISFCRWLYTAMTRSYRKAYIIQPPNFVFGDIEGEITMYNLFYKNDLVKWKIFLAFVLYMNTNRLNRTWWRWHLLSCSVMSVEHFCHTLRFNGIDSVIQSI